MTTIWTIGHSTRPVEEFVSMLAECGATQVADVRSVPHSRHNPQYDQAALRSTLESQGISYRYLAGLGGFRDARPDSPNTGWENSSFRGYADYMQTPEFSAALDELIALAEERPTAVMCAEAVPWRCHRSLIGDALIVRGFKVVDAISPGQLRPHKLTRFARVEGTRITYPPPSPCA